MITLLSNSPLPLPPLPEPSTHIVQCVMMVSPALLVTITLIFFTYLLLLIILTRR